MCCGIFSRHITLVLLEVVFATPFIFLWKDRAVYGPSGLGWFLFVCAVSVVGLIFTGVRGCCSGLFAIRWAANVILVFYMICQIGIAGVAGYYSYVFWYPLSGGRRRLFYDNNYADSLTFAQFMALFIIGGVCSVILGTIALVSTVHAWHVAQLRQSIQRRLARNQEYDEEKEHFLAKKQQEEENAHNSEQKDEIPQNIHHNDSVDNPYAYYTNDYSDPYENYREYGPPSRF
mmetsp:Transcript_19237/g.37723  ORF Transcript_19237/g.37723 Transcript_19237/m.37723 type:complete len:232 (-) Transcript_19237:346-1041(-)|eukprot:CAMPEP_0171502508 /NCGR_PEP_ID=MMETSP0958-20121227/10226_1 /TAXON_ID=87120 /ORGANISM="Aurantiochytrium limacinum, Strain ATCCMYA-1381" /LENGTH=231 /DNA_ID=CAMNT_0012037589 /DNA_START=330 /DNA_END=1025 /DNA_ORIENTATION=-